MDCTRTGQTPFIDVLEVSRGWKLQTKADWSMWFGSANFKFFRILRSISTRVYVQLFIPDLAFRPGALLRLGRMMNEFYGMDLYAHYCWMRAHIICTLSACKNTDRH